LFQEIPVIPCCQLTDTFFDAVKLNKHSLRTPVNTQHCAAELHNRNSIGISCHYTTVVDCTVALSGIQRLAFLDSTLYWKLGGCGQIPQHSSAKLLSVVDFMQHRMNVINQELQSSSLSSIHFSIPFASRYLCYCYIMKEISGGRCSVYINCPVSN